VANGQSVLVAHSIGDFTWEIIEHIFIIDVKQPNWLTGTIKTYQCRVISIDIRSLSHYTDITPISDLNHHTVFNVKKTKFVLLAHKFNVIIRHEHNGHFLEVIDD